MDSLPVTDLAQARAHSFRDRFSGAEFATEYRGIPIYAAPGLHELALERLLVAMPPQENRNILELGAGGGAMSLRLTDNGYRVCASDLFEDRFVPRGAIPFRPLDLNQPFADGMATFDAVVALELVEHLENPHHFLRQCRMLLRPGGVLIVSTPNLANPVSQAMFLREGVFQWFRDEDHAEQGHIMPLAPVVIRRSAAEAGLKPEWEGSTSDPLRMLHGRKHKRLRWMARLLNAMSGLPESHRGEVYLGVYRSSEDQHQF